MTNVMNASITNNKSLQRGEENNTMHVDNLMLEITRKCNLKCEHCLRGNAQNKSMDMQTMQHLFGHISSCDVLTIGGGEPSLAVKQLKELYQILAWSKTEIGNIFMVTNGKTIKADFLRYFTRIKNLCVNNDVSSFSISNDEFHLRERGFYRYPEDYDEFIRGIPDHDIDFNIADIEITEHTRTNTFNHRNVLARGRAKEWGHKNDPYLDCLKLNNLEKPTSILGEMYVCWDGDVVGDVNMAYNDMKKYKRGNIHSWDNLIQNLKQSTVDNYYHCKKHCNSFDACDEYKITKSQIERYIEKPVDDCQKIKGEKPNGKQTENIGFTVTSLARNQKSA